jgi:hypothetical protein
MLLSKIKRWPYKKKRRSREGVYCSRERGSRLTRHFHHARHAFPLLLFRLKLAPVFERVKSRRGSCCWFERRGVAQSFITRKTMQRVVFYNKSLSYSIIPNCGCVSWNREKIRVEGGNRRWMRSRQVVDEI